MHKNGEWRDKLTNRRATSNVHEETSDECANNGADLGGSDYHAEI